MMTRRSSCSCPKASSYNTSIGAPAGPGGGMLVIVAGWLLSWPLSSLSVS
jgi:hypothetical protein